MARSLLILFRSSIIFFVLFVAACAPGETQHGDYLVPPENLVWPPPPQQPKIKYLYSFRGPGDLGFEPSFIERMVEIFAGEENRRMVRPYAIAAADGLVAVADPGLMAVHFFNMKDQTYNVMDKIAGEQLVSPVGITFGPDRIFLADSALGKVFILDRNGGHLSTITSLARPTGIAYHVESGHLFVADTLSHKIVTFNADGKLLQSFGSRGGGDGEFNYPTHVTVHNNTLYVNDTMNFKIQAFNIDGSFLFSFGQVGDGSGNFAQPKGVGTDSHGNLYVVDAIFDSVQIFDGQGRFLLAFGDQGNRAGEFWLPTGVVIWQDKIFVADSYNERVQVFEFVGTKS